MDARQRPYGSKKARNTRLALITSAICTLIGFAPLRGAASVRPGDPPTDSEQEPTAERSELFDRISQRKAEFERDQLSLPATASPSRDDSSSEASVAQAESQKEPQKDLQDDFQSEVRDGTTPPTSDDKQGVRSLNRRPAIDPDSSLEGSAEPQL